MGPSVPRPVLPTVHVPERYGRSAMVRALVDAPVAPPEPRFLVAGSHYRVHPRGTRRVITSVAPGPLASASWVIPRGVDDDAIKSGAAVLLTFTKIRNEVGKGNDVFNQATLAALVQALRRPSLGPLFDRWREAA